MEAFSLLLVGRRKHVKQMPIDVSHVSLYAVAQNASSHTQVDCNSIKARRTPQTHGYQRSILQLALGRVEQIASALGAGLSGSFADLGNSIARAVAVGTLHKVAAVGAVSMLFRWK